MKKEYANCTSSKHRTPEEKKALTSRLRIIAGQINGIEQMIVNNRYCDDVLIQISSTVNALKSIDNEILKSHMKTYMVKDIKDEKYEVYDKLVELTTKYAGGTARIVR